MTSAKTSVRFTRQERPWIRITAQRIVRGPLGDYRANYEVRDQNGGLWRDRSSEFPAANGPSEEPCLRMVPLLLPMTLNPVEPRRCAAPVLPAPRVKRTIGVDKRSEHLHDEPPQVNRLADDLTVVRGVRGEVGMQLPGHASRQLHRRQ